MIHAVKKIYNSPLARKFYRTKVGRFVYHFPEIIQATLFKRGDTIIPPRWKVFTGRGDFEEIGQEFLNYFTTWGKLEPEHRVLDVGCGIGRMAVALSNYIKVPGAYYGFDIVREGIDWCEQKITPRYPDFHFKHVDIQNNLYNKKGSITADKFSFPYEDNFFDFVFLTSVFTHMPPEAIKNYVKEISRVLRPRRRCCITMYLLNDKSKQLIAEKKTILDFQYSRENYRTLNPEEPEHDVAFEEGWVRELHTDNNLNVIDPILYGSWCGRTTKYSTQDIIISEKRE